MKYFQEQKRKSGTFYRIRKNYHGQEIQVYQSPNKEQALHVYKECMEADWQEDKIKQIRQYYHEHRPLIHENQYITLDDKGGYRISKWKDGRVKYYGKTSTLEHARKIRDLLITKNWRTPIYKKPWVSNTRYIQRQTNGRYKIQRKGKYYGTYDTFPEALDMRRQLIENNWNNDIATYRKGKYNPYHNIIQKKEGGNYYVTKWCDGRPIIYSTCRTLIEALMERDFWESIGWDWDLLDLY